MQIGRMRRRVELQVPARVPDSDGGTAETWATLMTVWAAFEPPSAHNVERVIGGEVQGVIGSVVRIRYHASVTPKARLAIGARVFHIRGVRNVDDRDQWMDLAVEERQA